MGTPQGRSARKKGSTSAPVCVKPWRPRPAQGTRNVFVRLPLDIAMCLAQCTALVEFARACAAYVFEDCQNSALRSTGPPRPCLDGLDDFGRVIYAGTMSKSLYPSLRLG